MKAPISARLQANAASPITFQDVLQAVEQAADLKPGVRVNMRAAVIRCAHLVGNEGLSGPADVQSIAKRLEKMTPAKLGFSHRGSKAAFQSNLRRALRTAGLTIMPGRHRTPLAPPWLELAAKAQAHEEGFVWPPISRFVTISPSAVSTPTRLTSSA